MVDEESDAFFEDAVEDDDRLARNEKLPDAVPPTLQLVGARREVHEYLGPI
jgi:hypothetical protein